MHQDYRKQIKDKQKGKKTDRSTSKAMQSDLKFELRSDAEIWSSFKRDDMAAFIYIYNKYFAVLYNYGHKLSADDGLIEDCIQDVFVRIRETRHRLGDVQNIKLYLLKSFRTRYLHCRKIQSYQCAPDIEREDKIFGFTISAEQKIINAQLDTERIEALNRAIERLTAHQREAIYHFYYEGLSLDDIQEIMDVGSRRTIQNLIYRAIATLKRVLKVLPLFLWLCY